MNTETPFLYDERGGVLLLLEYFRGIKVMDFIPATVGLIPSKSSGSKIFSRACNHICQYLLTNIPKDFGEVIKAIAVFLGPVTKTPAVEKPLRATWKTPRPWLYVNVMEPGDIGKRSGIHCTQLNHNILKLCQLFW